jgi:hypothetical protein
MGGGERETDREGTQGGKETARERKRKKEQL